MNTKLVTAVSCAFSLAIASTLVSRGADTLKLGGVTEKTSTIRRETLSFPSATNTATFLVGPPEVAIEGSLLSKLGGSEITRLVAPPIENLLHNSGRFSVSDKPGPFRVLANVTDLRISQITEKKSSAVGGFFKEAFAKSFKINGEAFQADWSKDELQMAIQCSVTIQVRDQAGILLGGQTGSVLRQDSTKNIKAELAGLKYASGAAQTIVPIPIALDRASDVRSAPSSGTGARPEAGCRRINQAVRFASRDCTFWLDPSCARTNPEFISE
jgi:hypothetical protein